MTRGPLFSVIINNYNYGHYLREAIDSVLSQTINDYELIVVDDASLDHSQDIIKSYGDRLKAVLLEDNGGQAAAFNAGFQESRGEIICFLDADDVFLPNKLAEVAKAIDEAPDAILYHHQIFNADKDMKPLGTPFPRKPRSGNVSNIILKYGLIPCAPTSALCFRRSFLAEFFPMDTFINRINTDAPLRLFAFLLGPIKGIPHPLCYYRLHGENHFANTEQLQGNPQAIKSTMRAMERYYIYANSALAARGYNVRVDIAKNIFYRGYQTAIRKWPLGAFLLALLRNQVFPDLQSKIYFARRIIKWRQALLRKIN